MGTSMHHDGSFGRQTTLSLILIIGDPQMAPLGGGAVEGTCKMLAGTDRAKYLGLLAPPIGCRSDSWALLDYMTSLLLEQVKKNHIVVV